MPALWPQSHYLLPGVTGVLRAELAEVAERLRSALDLPPTERQLLAVRAEKLLYGVERPETLDQLR